MRLLITLATLSFALWSAPMQAETGALDDVEYQNLSEQDDADTKSLAQYNLWVCSATTTRFLGGGLRFEGYSQLFGAGSGQGQEARVRAFRDALRNCRQATRSYCHARIEACRVHRVSSRF